MHLRLIWFPMCRDLIWTLPLSPKIRILGGIFAELRRWLASVADASRTERVRETVREGLGGGGGGLLRFGVQGLRFRVLAVVVRVWLGYSSMSYSAALWV